MQFWKSIRYRISLFRRGEIEVVTVERLVFFTVQAAFLMLTLSILYWAVGHPVFASWAELSQALLETEI